MTKQKGFTLIELLVVIAIIGILSSIVLASLNSARTRGKDASAKGSLSSIRGSAELYYNGAGVNTYGTAGKATELNGTITGTMTGACADADVAKLLKAASQQISTSTVTCAVGLTGGSYVTHAPLLNPTLNMEFCVDSNGFAGETLASGIADTISAAVKCQ